MNENLPGRAASPTPERRNTAGNAALLIDFDNVTMGVRSDLQHQLRELLNSAIIKGKVAVQRAYADWRRYPQYIVPLSEASIDLIFAPAFGSNKKNATDIRLAIDALELVFTRPEISTFILLSGDSDFSSLVLKLKEYGKWVIGVGIRESASDLLVQNCDEYYSYSELTGLAKESEVEVLRRDPWELVVEATLRMKENNDTMRSDRLKQVMQQIDPHFDEKDAGFNRFSKFVLEAGRRHLLALTKMDSGQYEIELGSDANVPPDMEPAPAAADRGDPKPTAKPPKRRVEEAASTGALTLADGFALLKRTLLDLGAVGEKTVEGPKVLKRMKTLAEVDDDPIFKTRKFNGMLRQARDAKLIDLDRDGRVYKLALRPEASAEEATAAKAQPEAGGQPAKQAKKTKKAKKTTKAKKTANATATADVAAEGKPGPAAAEPAAKAEKPKAKRKSAKRSPKAEDAGPDPTAHEPSSPPPLPEVKSARRSIRGRGSSRTRKPKPRETGSSGIGQPAAQQSPEPPSTQPSAQSPGRRSIRGRGSSRARRQAPGDGPRHGAGQGPTGERQKAAASREQRGGRGPDSGGRSPRRPERPSNRGARAGGGRTRSRGRGRATTSRPSASNRRDEARSGSRPGGQRRPDREEDRRPRGEAPPDRGSSRETQASSSFLAKRELSEESRGGGLFKRMTAALQRAVRGEEKDD